MIVQSGLTSVDLLEAPTSEDGPERGPVLQRADRLLAAVTSGAVPETLPAAALYPTSCLSPYNCHQLSVAAVSPSPSLSLSLSLNVPSSTLACTYTPVLAVVLRHPPSLHHPHDGLPY